MKPIACSMIRLSLDLSAIVAAVFAVGCSNHGVNSDIREANNSFRYLDEVSVSRTLRQPAGTDPIVYNSAMDIKDLHDQSSKSALVGSTVDIRPPQKLIPLNNNVTVLQDGDIAYVWFSADDNGKDFTANDLLRTVLNLFKRSSISVDDIDAVNSVIKTDWYDATEFATPYTLAAMEKDRLIYRQKYRFGLIKNREGNPGVSIQLTDNVIEQTDGTELEDGLNRFEPARFTALMANRLMWSYNIDVKTVQDASRPSDVNISLGKDNNNLPCWVVDAPFNETYTVLERLMNNYDIDIKEYSSTKGELHIDYDEPDPEFWSNHQTEPWGLESGKYTFKLGVFNGLTTISLYDKDNKPVDTSVIAGMYSGLASSLTQEFFTERTSRNAVKK